MRLAERDPVAAETLHPRAQRRRRQHGGAAPLIAGRSPLSPLSPPLPPLTAARRREQRGDTPSTPVAVTVAGALDGGG